MEELEGAPLSPKECEACYWRLHAWEDAKAATLKAVGERLKERHVMCMVPLSEGANQECQTCQFIKALCEGRMP